MDTRLPIAAITDEFAPNLDEALEAMARIGMTGAELRMLGGRNIIDLSDDELREARAAVEARGMQVVGIASPILKCVLPGAPPVDPRFQQDTFASKHTFDDQPRLAERAFEIARILGCRLIRVFSYWRSVEPEACLTAACQALDELAEKAAAHDLIIGLENEHACNLATGAETARALARVHRQNLQVVWDPCNAYISGEHPYPEGYRSFPVSRIAHVHAKDCRIVHGKYVFGPLGTQEIDWKGQIAALLEDGYQGYVSLETHWGGPHGDKKLASIICGENLKGLLAA